jgi:PAS domain S-box-containing protein
VEVLQSLENREWEAQLRASEARKAAILDSVADPIFTLDHEGQILEYNQAAEQLAAGADGQGSSVMLEQWLRSQALGRELIERFPVLFGSREPDGLDHPILTAVTRPDGSPMAAEVTTNPIYLDGKPLLTVCLRDITQQRRAEEERAKLAERVAQTQKLESLGLLASGIAHDFNNLLAVILSGTELAVLEMPRESPVRRRVEEVKNAALHASDLTQQMLAYAGQGRTVVEALDLSRIVEDLTHLLRASLSRSAILETRFDPDVPRVQGDRAQLRQVILNLITNASDAIREEGGTIVVQTGETRLDKRSLRGLIPAKGLTPGRYSYLEVSDTGCGMDRETQKRIFDPFYSTKSQGRGLGLSSTLGIVRSHRGALRVQSRPGHGTSVRLLLPSLEHVPEEATRTDAPAADWRGSGTALLIEDEAGLRRITGEMLERIGFQVLTVATGEEGLRVLEGNREDLAVVILDLTMPGIGGQETYRRIRELLPEIPVIVTSGYSREEARRILAHSTDSAFLQKPYRLRTLVETLRALLRD